MKTSTLILLATAALLTTPTLLSTIQTTASPQGTPLSTLGLTSAATRDMPSIIAGNLQLSISPLINPVQAFSIYLGITEQARRESESAGQPVTPTHERSVERGESVHIVNTIESRAVSIEIIVDVSVGEGATVNVIKDVHPPQEQISLPVVAPELH